MAKRKPAMFLPDSWYTKVSFWDTVDLYASVPLAFLLHASLFYNMTGGDAKEYCRKLSHVPMSFIRQAYPLHYKSAN